MTSGPSGGRRFLLSLAAAAAATASLSGYVFIQPSSPIRWFSLNPEMELQLGGGTTLIDGAPSFDTVFEYALANWNGILQPLYDRYVGTPLFYVVRNSTAPRAEGNGRNNVFFASSNYGRSFPANAVAVTQSTSRMNEDGFWERMESDVIFNSAVQWNSYRGALRPPLVDLYRVALHEAGHVLGLDHPDLNGQSRTAQMNSTASDLDDLAIDDIQGVQALYTLSPPGPPLGLQSSTNGSSVTFSWAPPATGVPTGYILRAGTRLFFSTGSAIATIHTGTTATSYTATGVGAGVYYVRLSAANWGGESQPTSDIEVVVGGACTTPGAPTLTVIANSGGSVTLGWTVPSGSPTSYVLQAGSRAGLADLYNADVGSGATFTAPSVGAGTYFVRVLAKNSCGALSAASNEVTLVVAPVITTPTPTGTVYTGTFSGTYTSVGRFTLGTCTWRFTYNGRQTMTLTARSDGTLTSSSVHVTGTRATGPGTSSSSRLTCEAGSFSVDDYPSVTGTTSSLRWTSGFWTFTGSLSANRVTGTLTTSGGDGTYTYSGSIPNITLTRQ